MPLVTLATSSDLVPLLWLLVVVLLIGACVWHGISRSEHPYDPNPSAGDGFGPEAQRSDQGPEKQ